ncbi:biotin--[acetyl-CoA-carboxylase] ligase [Pelolinea submarina]|uniref:BirA family biotin operon repressor/biotin-[acetyl-CoA-carboxylase] ligase n=1 Tax=Pelolinea submarina TaxID=913107 RepID=A0A347ZVN2_9CHLR|nr:biotin--[acetyl-CoA-carboxylase] ligase [Pelolinea submarina]REG07058.1 BirA family biotin operon repressor/biotin-[acetyl-CoA-carboxylase] ligase [Pelolinea submarina]BBB49363.1 BirA family transcriptional regulator, biotin operon repressor /biotin-[acetyl-CoA-carboxylase] ligase [Pelolinea submarina]
MQENQTPIQLTQALSALPLARVLYFEETDSTNAQGLLLAAQGAEDNTLLVAERQSAGRGRFGRKWVTAPGTSLAFSLVMRPTPAEAAHLSLFALLGASAVRRAAQIMCGCSALVKWPNDVLLDGRKTSGILAESAWQGDKLSGLVLGIGINILPGSVPPDEGLLYPATCLQAHCALPIERYAFLASVLEQLISLRGELTGAAFLADFNEHLAFKGQMVSLSATGSDPVSGILQGVGSDGCLRLLDENGQINSYPVGDLRLRPRE